MFKEDKVTPFVGVWIETDILYTESKKKWVTPFVGVWIETGYDRRNRDSGMSHPSWVCGLKHNILNNLLYILCHTLRGCVD